VAGVDDEPAALEGGDADAASPPAVQLRRGAADVDRPVVGARDRGVDSEGELRAGSEPDVPRRSWTAGGEAASASRPSSAAGS
jgi:hypothetical protein